MIHGVRDILVIFGCVVFLGALMGSIASIVGVSSSDATGPVVAAALAGFGLGLAVTALFPGTRR